jgi:hypothetical protein
MNEVGLAIVFFGILGLAMFVALIMELFELRSHQKQLAMWTELVEEYIEGYENLKTAINNNANIVRLAGTTINEHDRILRVMAIVVDLHSETLKIAPGLRERLETSPVDGYVMEVGEEVE